MQLIIPQLKRPINSDDDGEHFEEFCKAFCQLKYGSIFRPLGGKKDGGRDGLYLNPDKSHRIYQFSVQEKVSSKIDKTFTRLQEFLQEKYEKFAELIYITNRTVKDAEELEEKFEGKYGKRLRIHDIAWLMANLRSEDGTLKVANDYYYSDTKPLYEIEIHPQVYVFFQMMTSGDDDLLDYTLDLRSRALDALILEKLKDTSSEKRMKRDDLVQNLIQDHLWVKGKLVDASLKRLNEKHSKKENVRLINYHKREDEICLPYDTVCEVRERRNEAVALCDYVAGKVKEFLSEFDSKENEFDRVWAVVQNFLSTVFSTRGTRLLDWAENKTYILGREDIDLLNEALKGRGIRDPRLQKTYQYVLNRLLSSRSDSKIMSFLVRLNESYLLHLISGRDIKIHSILDGMRRGLTVVCCSSILIPQLSDYIRNQEGPLLKQAKLVGIRILTTESYLEELKSHLKDSLAFDRGLGKMTEFARLAVEKRVTVKELLSEIGLQVPHFSNLFLVLKEALGIELLTEIPSKTEAISRLANSLKPYRENSFQLALADASTLYYIKDQQEKARNHYSTWWLTTETQTVKVAISLGVNVDSKVYMRLSFLQDMLLLPGREDIEQSITPTWAQDTLLLATPSDAMPNDLMEPYRKARKKFENASSPVVRTNTFNMMNAFMALGCPADRTEK